MIETFTRNDVLRYIYDDLEPDKKQEISTAIIVTEELMDFYLETLETKGALDILTKEPSENSVKNILNYSRSFIYNSI